MSSPLPSARSAVFDGNKRTYDSQTAARLFDAHKDLQRPEAAIALKNRAELAAARMLDIGVGGGRTTHYFLSRVRAYVGVDYSPAMIAACKRVFAPLPPNAELHVCDALDLSRFGPASFDFILFSYNGIDAMSHEERLRAFAEIKRVGAPGGRFCFSSHNLHALDRIFRLRLTRHPIRLLKRVYTVIRTRLANPAPDTLLRHDHAVIHEPAHALGLRQYFIKPDAQVRQLQEAGFSGIEAYDLRGCRIADQELSSARDPWVYYLCRI